MNISEIWDKLHFIRNDINTHFINNIDKNDIHDLIYHNGQVVGVFIFDETKACLNDIVYDKL